MKKANILIVVDMQNDFIDGSLGSKEAQAIVPNVVEKIKNFNGLVIATADTHDEDYLATHEGKYLPVVHCVEGTPGWEINDDVKAALDAAPGFVHRLDKITFGSIDLPNTVVTYAGGLANSDADLNITLVGLCTDICVMANAVLLRANFPEANITVDSSCCAGVTVESHNAALTIFKSQHIDVI